MQKSTAEAKPNTKPTRARNNSTPDVAEEAVARVGKADIETLAAQINTNVSAAAGSRGHAPAAAAQQAAAVEHQRQQWWR